MAELYTEDGENLAVRYFLLAYGGGNKSLSIGAMQTHLKFCGVSEVPEWVAGNEKEPVTKGAAQMWLRYLFDMYDPPQIPIEVTTP